MNLDNIGGRILWQSPRWPLVYKPDPLAKGTQVFPERKDERKWISCWLWTWLLVVRVPIKGTHVGTSGASGRHMQPGWLPAKRRDLSPTTIGPRFSQQSREPGKGPGTRERDTSSAACETLGRGPSPMGPVFLIFWKLWDHKLASSEATKLVVLCRTGKQTNTGEPFS